MDEVVSYLILPYDHFFFLQRHTSSNRCNADGLIYGELTFADRTTSDIIIGSLPNTQYAQISFTAGIQPLHD